MIEKLRKINGRDREYVLSSMPKEAILLAGTQTNLHHTFSVHITEYCVILLRRAPSRETPSNPDGEPTDLTPQTFETSLRRWIRRCRRLKRRWPSPLQKGRPGGPELPGVTQSIPLRGAKTAALRTPVKGEQRGQRGIPGKMTVTWLTTATPPPFPPARGRRADERPRWPLKKSPVPSLSLSCQP